MLSAHPRRYESESPFQQEPGLGCPCAQYSLGVLLLDGKLQSSLVSYILWRAPAVPFPRSVECCVLRQPTSKVEIGMLGLGKLCGRGSVVEVTQGLPHVPLATYDP